MAAIACRLDTIEADLRTALPEDLGGATAQARLAGRITTAHRAVMAAGTPGTPRARSTLKRAVRQLRIFNQLIGRGMRRGKVRAVLGDRVSGATTEVLTRLLPLAQQR